MKLSLRSIIRRSMTAIAVLGLSLSALVLTSGNVPGASAASSPTITTTSPNLQAVNVTGNGFGYGDTVFVGVYDSNYNLKDSQYTTASKPFCWKMYCITPGYISTSLVNIPSCWQTVHVIAYDYGLGVWSNWSNVYINCIG